MNDFDCIVLGNEPAGLWLLKEFSHRAKSNPKSKLAKSIVGSIKLAWLQVGPPIAPIAVPTPVARAYRIGDPSTLQTEFSAEFVTPKRVFTWDADHITRYVPEISSDFSSLFLKSLNFPSHRESSSLRAALTAHPELLDVGKALWKKVGRGVDLTGEMLLWNALLCHRFVLWDAQHPLKNENNIEVSALSGTEEISNVSPNSDGRISIEFKSGLKFRAKTLILNSSVRILSRLCRSTPQLLEWSHSPQETLSGSVHYPLRMSLAPEVLPLSLSPLTFALKSDLLPEPDSEIWQLDFIRNTSIENSQVKLWVTDRYDFSLESLLEKFRIGLSHFYKVFPKAIKEISHYSFPLNMDTCYSESQRNHHLVELESEGIESYRLTRGMVSSEQRSLFTLMPYLNCSYPYPLGTLMAAESLLRELFGKNLESR